MWIALWTRTWTSTAWSASFLSVLHREAESKERWVEEHGVYSTVGVQFCVSCIQQRTHPAATSPNRHSKFVNGLGCFGRFGDYCKHLIWLAKCMHESRAQKDRREPIIFSVVNGTSTTSAITCRKDDLVSTWHMKRNLKGRAAVLESSEAQDAAHEHRTLISKGMSLHIRCSTACTT